MSIDPSIDQDGYFMSGEYAIGFDIHNRVITFAVVHAESKAFVAHGTINAPEKTISLEDKALLFIENALTNEH